MIIVALLLIVLVSSLLTDPHLYMSIAGLPTMVAALIAAWWGVRRYRATRSQP